MIWVFVRDPYELVKSHYFHFDKFRLQSTGIAISGATIYGLLDFMYSIEVFFSLTLPARSSSVQSKIIYYKIQISPF